MAFVKPSSMLRYQLSVISMRAITNLVPWAFLCRGGGGREKSPENEVGIGAPYLGAPMYYSVFVSRVIL